MRPSQLRLLVRVLDVQQAGRALGLDGRLTRRSPKIQASSAVMKRLLLQNSFISGLGMFKF